MKVFAAFVALFCQDPEKVILINREEFLGEIQEYRRDGTLLFKDSSKVRELPIEDVARLFFEKAPALAQEAGEKLRLRYGELLTGKGISLADGTFAIDTVNGKFRVPRAEVKTLTFAPLDGAIPELKEEKGDILLWKASADGKTEIKAAYGALVAVTEEMVTLSAANGEKWNVPRAHVRIVYLQQESKGRSDVPTGWFARLQFKNGDKLLGTLRALEKDAVTLFSPLFGPLSFKKSLLHSVSFVQYARMSVGNIIVCEQNGVREIDRSGNTLWSYHTNVNSPWAARKLENGNVIIANTNLNQLLEVRPKDKSGGEVVWQMDGLNYPYDVQRLPNGNTLVAEYYSQRVVEYDSKKSVVWQTARAQYPISAQRLENGNTLIVDQARSQVIEVDAKDNEKWRATLSGMRPWRAERLDNGNTLVVDNQRHIVVEIDSKSREVWRKEGLSRPVAAIRLDDGNTLILEQGKNQITEVDPSGKTVAEIKKLNYPLHFSTY